MLVLLFYMLWILTTHGTVLAERRSFLWFSDIHLDPYYGTDQAVIHDKVMFEENCKSPDKLLQYPYGDFGCDAPPLLLQSLLESAAHIKADFVIITGDLCRHGNEELLPCPMNATQDILQNVSRLLRQHLGDTIPIVPSIGNNDVTPDYYLDIDNPREMIQMISHGLSPLFLEQTDEGVKQFEKGGFYAHNVTDTITVLSLNTILYSINRQPPRTVKDPLDQFAWMEQQLQLANNSNHRQIYIVGHIPPTIGSYRHTQLWQEDYLERYYQIVHAYSDIIKGQLFGHIHTDEFRVHGIFPLFLTSSFTPIYGSNPSYRVVTYDNDTGDLLDYQVYYLDLDLVDVSVTDDGITTAPQWLTGQAFTQAFEVPDMSLASLQLIVQDLQNSTEASIYWEALLTRLHVYTHGQEVCDSICRQEWACTLSSTTEGQYKACLGYVPWWQILGMVVLGVSGMAGLIVALRCGKRCLQRRNYEDIHHHHHHHGEEAADEYEAGEQQLPQLS
jgi:sphingomyelin phosphodiesterase acid-like 3